MVQQGEHYDEEYDEEEGEIEFSNLVDGQGNRLPMFSNEFWAFKQDEYLYLHHELPGEQVPPSRFPGIAVERVRFAFVAACSSSVAL